jgi:biopolymer transport protein ExbB
MLEPFLSEIALTWGDGGWVMIPLALLALFMYAFAADLFFTFTRSQYRQFDPDTCRHCIRNPESISGPVGEIIRYGRDEVASLQDIRNRFEEVRLATFPKIDRRLFFLVTLTTAAPLLGLLGTVLGMISTFDAMAGGGGRVIEMVSAGISTALITTKTGLLIAIPGYFMASAIRRRRNEYAAFLAGLESLTMQHFHQAENNGRAGT